MFCDNYSRKLYVPLIEEVQSVNALKFVCALMVVGIHVDFVLRPYVLFLYRIAVPVFFMISGYFLLSQDGTVCKEKVAKIIRKILKLAVWSNLLYIGLNFCLDRQWLYPVLPTLLSGDTICCALWYLTAYIQCLLIIWLLVRYRITYLLPIISVMGFLAGVLCGSYSWILGNEPCSLVFMGQTYNVIRNALTVGLPCLTLGIALRYYERWIADLCKRIEFVYMYIWMALLVVCGVEYFSLSDLYQNTDVQLATLPLAFMTLAVCLTLLRHVNMTSLARLGKSYSTRIYIFHICVYKVLRNILSGVVLFGIDLDLYKQYWMYPLVLVVLIAVLKLWDIAKQRFTLSQSLAYKD